MGWAFPGFGSPMYVRKRFPNLSHADDGSQHAAENPSFPVAIFLFGVEEVHDVPPSSLVAAKRPSPPALHAAKSYLSSFGSWLMVHSDSFPSLEETLASVP